MYSDGVEVQGFERTGRPLVTDSEIMAAACGIYRKTVTRRIRIRSVCLWLEDLIPLGYQPDLFEPEAESRCRRLQQAVDDIQNRFGTGKLTRGIALANGKQNNAAAPITC
jgi:hypothetical protein